MGEIELSEYPFTMRPLTPEEGGGYLITYPDFDKCIADGETIAEAITEGGKALAAVIEVFKEKGWPLPAPSKPRKA